MNIQAIEKHLLVLWNFLVPPEALVEPPQTDLVFVLGNKLSYNATEGIRLWKCGKAPYLLFTGKDEAARDEKIAREHGIPWGKILVENDSTNTLANVQNGMRLVGTQNWQVNSLTAIAVPFHLRRVLATFKHHYPRLTVHPRSSVANFGQMTWALATPSLLARIPGEVERLERYATKGDCARVEITANVRKSAEIVNDFIKAQH